MNEIKPNNISLEQTISPVNLQVSEPKDFSEGGSEHRRGIIANASLIVVLISSTELQPALLGIKVSVPMLWILISVTHMYFFTMWRITAPIEADTEMRFWNIKGLQKQAFMGGVEKFPGKTKAQEFFLRALPIWAFIFGLLGIVYGLASSYCA